MTLGSSELVSSEPIFEMDSISMFPKSANELVSFSSQQQVQMNAIADGPDCEDWVLFSFSAASDLGGDANVPSFAGRLRFLRSVQNFRVPQLA